jgi:four helix bundle protein
MARMMVKELYLVTADIPDNERFGVISQMRRAAISIPSNIAEGCGRGTNKDLSRFLDMSLGSLCEIETLCYLCEDLDFIAVEKIEFIVKRTEEIRKMTIGFQKTLK